MTRLQPPTSDPRSAKLRLLAITAGAWGLYASRTARSACAQNSTAGQALERLRIDYREPAVSLLIHKEQAALEKSAGGTSC